MSEKRFTSDEEGNILDDGDILTVEEVLEYLNWYRRDMLRFSVENEQLKQELAELLAVHTKIMETLDSEFVSKALEDGD